MIKFLQQKFLYHPYSISFQYLHGDSIYLDHWVSLTIWSRAPEAVLPQALQHLAKIGLTQFQAEHLWRQGQFMGSGWKLRSQAILQEYRYQGKILLPK